MQNTLGPQANLRSTREVSTFRHSARCDNSKRVETTFGIGEVARRVGLQVSAVRYYESCGLVEPEGRRGGKRIYSERSIERLALIVYAKELGFSIAQIRKLLNEFPGARWSGVAAEKLEALDAMSQRIATMREALQKISRCGCRDVDECAHAIAVKRCR